MVINEIPINVIQGLPPEIIANIGTLINILKAFGIIFILYLIFSIISSIINIRRNLLIKKIYKKLEEIEKNLNKLIHKKS